jgi:putative ABC transport system permease protein
MIKNYLLIAFRSLKRQFTYSLINIFGLAIGLACSLVILMYVYGEWSYDRHHKNADRIYRIGISFFNMGGFAIGPEALGEFLPQYEGVEAFTRVGKNSSLSISTGTKEFKELAYYTDTSFFKIFSYEFVQGDAHTALKDANAMVITQSMAKNFFGDMDPLGQTLLIGKDKKPFTVTGIVKDDSRNSQLKSSIWLSNINELSHEMLWTSANPYNYVMMKEGQQQKDLDAVLANLLEKEVYPKANGVPAGISFEDYKKHPNAVQFFVHALTDVHLESKLNYEISPGGDKTTIYTFGAVSVFILLLASVNFINLTTARASRRAKEVGVRKVVGSSRTKLIAQFITESLIVSAVAMVLAILFGQLFLYIFQMITGSELIPTLWNAWNLMVLVIFALVVGLLSGIYPAFYLTAFKPVNVLKGNWSVSGGALFRNVLVVAQFTISLCLMMCAAVIIRQMEFMKSKDLGFNQQNIITIDRIPALKEHAEAFRDQLSKLADISEASLHSGEPGNESVSTFSGFKSKNMQEGVAINTYLGDEQFIPLMSFQLIKGRTFNKALASDTAAVILNEAAVKLLGLKEPVGTILEDGLTVVGVVKDFHWESLRQKIAPSAFMLGRTNNYFQLSLRINNASASKVIKATEAEWKKLVPDEPLSYHFVDENFGQMLEKEKVLGNAIGFFTVLAILISCLGLYGLSAYTTEQRSKEIGIRKVLGANASHILVMLNRKFATLVLISAGIATPLTLYFMNKWIHGFAYHVELQAWIFISAILCAFVIALFTVSFHSIKASMTNPVDTLKHE